MLKIWIGYLIFSKDDQRFSFLKKYDIFLKKKTFGYLYEHFDLLHSSAVFIPIEVYSVLFLLRGGLFKSFN